MTKKKKNIFASIRPLAWLHEISFRDLAISAGPLVLITAIVIMAAYWYVRPAPPNTITIISGPPGSVFQLTAEKYRKIMARNRVKLRILPSEGSLENLKKLNDPRYRIDIGFVQGGVSTGVSVEKLVSLGSVFHEPLVVFYRSAVPMDRISGLNGKRLAIGREGSGTHALALILLKSNGIEPGGATTLMTLSGEDAAQALIEGKVDAAFLMGDSAAPPIMRKLLRTADIRLLDIAQADAYIRRFPYLNKLDLPMGVFDFDKNIPSRDIHLIGPMVELVARDNLHPALSDLLIETAREVHGGASLLQRAGEFPAPLEHDFRISEDARRFYSSGKGFIYRSLPFWLATLVDRTLVFLVPVVVLLIPGMKMVPKFYNWRVRSRIYRVYGKLIALERSMLSQPAPEEREEMLKQLDDIETEVNQMTMPLAFADQFYVLRDHIGFVRGRYSNSGGTA
jgi:TRAP transporter TAXI family solute receptor